MVIVRDSRLRRGFDLVLAAIAVLVASPILGLAVLYLKIRLRGTAFAGEERVGSGQRAFRLIRLRPAGAGRMLETLGVAAWPELLNVLRGQMSLVGPRPCSLPEAAWYTPSETHLFAVRPGMISPAWRPLRHRSDGSADTRVEEREAVAADRLVELHYIQHRTVAGDAWIIVRALAWLVLSLIRRFIGGLRRALPWVIADALIVFASFYVAYMLRFFDSTRPYGASSASAVIWAILLSSAGFALVNLCFRLHRRAWRYAAGVEVLPIAVATLISGAAATALDLVHPLTAVRPLPISVVLVGSFFSAVGFAVFRYRNRVLPAITVLARPASKAGVQPTRAVVYGAGEVGQLLVRRLRTHIDGRRYKIVAFLDDDPRKHGLTVHRIKVVGGRSVLRAFVAKEKVDVIVLAMGSTTGDSMREILALAHGTAAQIKVAHDVVNWMGDRYSVALLRDMRAEDLIGRRATGLERERCRDLVGGKTVLVTGACGSIGSELIRQILGLEPGRIVAVDMNESGLYDLAIETKTLRADVDLHIVVGDVTNRERMLELMRTERPEVVFHVAAYKHVPLMELYPHEAAWTNVWGTWVMADAAAQSGSVHFVLVSTDKAVNPSSIMGATKRMAEILVHGSRDVRLGHVASTVRMTVVRFGNVLGSRGSVIPTFERQIELGGPVTVTHPDMTRYFMHPEEAAALIVEAASLSAGDEVFMLDMGDRVRIEDLAHRMIRLRGLRPNVDIALEFTGLRPGEKLHEELIYGHEHRIDTAHPRVFQIASQRSPFAVETRMTDLLDAFVGGTVDRHDFSGQLVAIASELVENPESAAGQPVPADHALVGRRRSVVREAAVPG